MSTRSVVIGSATIVALLVLLVTLFWPTTGTSRPVVKPDDLPETGDPWSDPAGATDFLVTRRGDDGQVVEVFGQQLNPQPMGVMEVQWPGARIHLVPNQRVIEIRGEHGTFVAPDNHPESGRFVGPTVLTLFENPGEGPLDLRDDSPHIQMRIFLTDATFDLDLRTVESDRAIHLTSRRVDFRGRGLRLTYNELRRRLERLEIFEGEQVRIHRDAEFASLLSDQEPQDSVEGEAMAAEDQPVPPADDDDRRPPQYYQANFDRQVRIVSPEVQVAGDVMRLLFAMSSKAVRENLDDVDDTSGPDAPLPVTTTNAATPIGGRPQADRPLPEAQSMIEAAPDDILIQWSGRLRVEPLEQMPDGLTLADDLLFVMGGAPLTIDTAKNEHITAGSLDYQLATGRVRLHAADAGTVVMTTPKLGRLEVANLTIDQQQAIGWVDGPGSLRAAGDMPEVVVADAATADLTGLPAGTTVSWQERVALTFTKRPEAEQPADDQPAKLNRLASVRRVTLRGNVDVQHPQLAMQSREASISLTPPTDGRPGVDRIEASGDVHVHGREEHDDAEFDVQSQLLTIMLDRDERGRTYPSHLLARDDVRVTQPGGQLREARMGEVRIDLATVPEEVAAEDGSAAQESPIDALAVGDEPEGDASALDGIDADAAPTAPANFSEGLMPMIVTEDVFSLVPIELPLLADRASFEAAPDGSVAVEATEESMKQPGEEAPDEAVEPAPVVAESSPKPDHPDLVVRRVRMSDEVMIDVADPEVRITAERVDADMSSDQYELFGRDAAGDVAARDATLYRDGATLAGRHIVMSELNQSVYIDTPGTLTFTSRAPQREGDEATEAADDRTPVDLTITWTEAMWFDNKNGMALFTGDVVCDARTDRETSRLAGETLRVRFVTIDADVLEAADDEQRDDAMTVQRALVDVQAMGEARFTAASFSDEVEGTLDTRLTLVGPSIVFDNLQQQVQMDSAGEMLFEDYRPAADGEDEAADENSAAATSPIGQISGRGATLFTWTGYLRVDVLNNELLIDRDVRMVHRPVGDKRVATLDCQQIIARLQGEGGLGVWLSDDAPQPELAEVLAVEDVRMRAQDRHVSTDLLHYDAAANVVKLSARDGRKTQVYEPDSTQPLQAQHFEWDIARNRVKATRVGVIRMGVQTGLPGIEGLQ